MPFSTFSLSQIQKSKKLEHRNYFSRKPTQWFNHIQNNTRITIKESYTLHILYSIEHSILKYMQQHIFALLLHLENIHKMVK